MLPPCVQEAFSAEQSSWNYFTESFKDLTHFLEIVLTLAGIAGSRAQAVSILTLFYLFFGLF